MSYQYISNLPVGAKVKLGKSSFINKYTDGTEDLTWTIISKDHHTLDSGYPVNGITLFSEKVIRFQAYDAKEPNNYLSQRRTNGNNRYRTSNIRQWLNTAMGANQWFVPQNISGRNATDSADAAPSTSNIFNTTRHYPYNNDAGFLSSFKATELELFLKTNIKSATHDDFSVPDGNSEMVAPSIYADNMSDYLFLLSLAELTGAGSGVAPLNIPNYKEGVLFPYFATEASRRANATPLALLNSYNYNLDSVAVVPYATRTVNLDSATNIYEINPSGGYFKTGSVHTPMGIRPAVNIRNDSLVSVDPDENGYYQVFRNAAPEVKIVKQDLLTVDFTVIDVHDSPVECKIYLNDNLEKTITSGFENTLSYKMPYSQMLFGDNQLKFVTRDEKGEVGSYIFKVNMKQIKVPQAGGTVMQSEFKYFVGTVENNNDGTSTLKTTQNLLKTVRKNDAVEIMTFSYTPSIYLGNSVLDTPIYGDMQFVGGSYNNEDGTFTEEWEKIGTGKYAFTKIKLKREKVTDKVSIEKIGQMFTYKEDN